MQRSNSPLPGHDAQSNARGMPGGGMLRFRIDRRISGNNKLCIDHRNKVKVPDPVVKQK